jgi:hypothetical protein
MGKKQELRPKAIEAARVASRTALMGGQATSASVADIAVTAYLTACDEQAEVVAWRLDHPAHGTTFSHAPITDGDRSLGWVDTPLYASPPAVAAGGVTATWHPLDAEGYAELRVNGARITTFASYPAAEEAADRINKALAVGDEGIREGDNAVTSE